MRRLFYFLIFVCVCLQVSAQMPNNVVLYQKSSLTQNTVFKLSDFIFGTPLFGPSLITDDGSNFGYTGAGNFSVPSLSNFNGVSVGSNGAFVQTNAHNQSVIANCTTTNATNAYSCSTSPTFTPVAGDRINVIFNAANTGAATLNVNGAGAKNILKWGNANALVSLVAGDIQAAHSLGVYYDGTEWQPEGQLGNGTATLGASNAFTGANTFSGGLINTTKPIRDQSRFVLISSMTAATATTGLGASGAGNTTFSWPVVSGNWYDMECELPVAFAASATIRFQLYQVSGATAVSVVNTRTFGNTGASAVFQDLFTLNGSSLVGSQTPITGAPGASEMIHFSGQFLTSGVGNIGLEFISNGTNTVQPLIGSTCVLTQVN